MPELEIAQRGRPLGGPLSRWFNFRLLPFLGAFMACLVGGTLRIRWEGDGAVDDIVLRGERFIMCFYHRRLFEMYMAYKYRQRYGEHVRQGLCLLSSDSKDGERSAATWHWFGVHAVRGTAGERGAQALVRMIQAVKQGWDFAITVDGPRGPRQKVKGGAVIVSRRTGAWLVPVCIVAEHAWKLRTWDEMLIPMPFSRAIIRFGQPFRVEPGGDEEASRLQLEETLDGMETWAEGAFRV